MPWHSLNEACFPSAMNLAAFALHYLSKTMSGKLETLWYYPLLSVGSFGFESMLKKGR